jgi:hypothetical protein
LYALSVGVHHDPPTLQGDAGVGVQLVGHEHLTDRLQHHVGGEGEDFAGGHRAAAFIGPRAHERNGADLTGGAMQTVRRRPVADAHAVGLRPVLLIARRRHLVGPAAIDDGDVLGAQPARLRGGIDGGIAAADHHDPASDRQG